MTSSQGVGIGLALLSSLWSALLKSNPNLWINNERGLCGRRQAAGLGSLDFQARPIPFEAHKLLQGFVI